MALKMSSMESAIYSTEVQFPMISFERPSVIEVIFDSVQMGATNTIALKNGYFDNIRYFREEGPGTVEILKVVDVASVTWLSGYRLGYRDVQLTLRLSVEKTAPLDVLRSKVLKAFRADRYFWESNGMYEERLVKIRDGTTFTAFVEALSDPMLAAGT